MKLDPPHKNNSSDEKWICKGILSSEIDLNERLILRFTDGDVLDMKADVLIDEYFECHGHLVHLRVEPPEFLRAAKEIGNLIDDQKHKAAQEKIESLPFEWRNDPEFIRLGAFNSFERED